ncbi:SpoIIIAH-like family protein [Selenomonadales bacterium OttesenSCG-928-I06]|nr:SpoIIIAH-like family protein [Selenomonadales bacterium OttesenSCG-928-I06]
MISKDKRFISVIYFNRKMKIICCILVALVLFSLGYLINSLFFSGSNEDKPMIDRSNAMEVAKSIEDIKDPIDLDKSMAGLSSVDFFTEYRLERDRIRSERTDILRDVLKNAKTDETRAQAQDAILQMTLEKKIESETESLIKSKGFNDALVFFKENSANAIIKASSLSKEEVIQVAEVISSISGINPENITISANP